MTSLSRSNAVVLLTAVFAFTMATPLLSADRWDAERARAWAETVDIVRGCNYLPGTAGNSTEMWQAADWREDVIEKELELAASTGLNTVRVFVQYLVWESDPEGLLDRMDRFLEMADAQGIQTMWVLFDDCAFGYPAKTDPYLGDQGDPKPGEYSPYWTPSPGHSRVYDREAWPQLDLKQAYALGVFG